MAKILAIETATNACSVALLVDNKIYDRFILAPQEHTRFVLPMVQEILSLAQLEFNHLDAIAFGCGPGSFTGVRLAASLAQGFAFAAKLPVIGVSTLRTLAQEVFVEFKAAHVVVAQDARMQEIYWGEYQVDSNGMMQAITPDRLTKVSEIDLSAYEALVGVGSGFQLYQELIDKSKRLRLSDKQYPLAKYIVLLAANDLTQGSAVSAEKALPTYLREKVVSL